MIDAFKKITMVAGFISYVCIYMVFSRNIQVGLTAPDSKFVTTINQIDPEKETALRVAGISEQQERDSKHKG